MRIALLALAVSTAAFSVATAQEAAQAPAAEAAPAPAAPPEQQLAPLPTDPLGLTILDTLEKVCKPIAMGTGQQADVAKAAGFTMQKKLWTKVVDKASGAQVVLVPWSQANPTTCTMTINHAKGGFQDMVNGIHAWASRQDPILQLRAPYSYVDQTSKVPIKRTTVGWETADISTIPTKTGMSFTQLERTDGKEIVRGVDQSELMYQIRK
jgi:hypothetical protein